MIATIGTFDGVHLGHQYLLHELVAAAHKRHTKSLVVTFNPHPKAVIAPDDAPRLLTTLRQRVEMIRDAGVDFVHVVTFNEEVRRMSAVEFVGRLRTIYTDLDSIIFGFNNTIGSDRNGGEPEISKGLKAMGIDILSIGEAPVHASSTAIRRHLENGRVGDANALLGRRYSVRGKVVEGYGIGHTIGFPTANVMPESSELLVPAVGVYAAIVTIDDTKVDAMLNIGHRPTFADGEKITIEANQFDFHDNIYGRDIDIEFVDFIRDERRFDSPEALRLQLDADRHTVHNILNNLNK